MNKIIGIEWINGRDCIGVVAIETDIGGWKAYIGVAKGVDEKNDAQFIANYGSKLPEHIARAFFPEIISKSGYDK